MKWVTTVTEKMTTAEYLHQTSVGAKGKTPESLLKEVCITWLRLNGWLTYAWFQQGMVPKSLQGMPDRIAVKNGRHVWIEFKRPGKNPSPMQKVRHAELRAAGATVLVVHTLDELTEQIGED